MDGTNWATFIPVIYLLSLLLLRAHNKDDPPDIATHPSLSPCPIVPTVLNAAPCLLFCAWQSQLQYHCKGHQHHCTSTQHPSSNTCFPRDNPSRDGGHHPDFHGYWARTTMGRRGSSLLYRSLTPPVTGSQDGDGLGDKQVTQTICTPLQDPAPAALPEHLQVLQACWEVGQKKYEEPMYSHLHISKNQ